MKRWLAWRETLTVRERGLVDLAAGLTALVVLAYGLILPIGAAFDAAAVRHGDAVQRSARLLADLKALDAAPRAGGGGTQPIEPAISAAAQEAGLVVQSLQPRGRDRVVVAIAAAPAPAALGWIDRMGRAGLAVEALSLRPAADGTVAIDVTLRRP